MVHHQVVVDRIQEVLSRLPDETTNGRNYRHTQTKIKEAYLLCVRVQPVEEIPDEILHVEQRRLNGGVPESKESQQEVEVMLSNLLFPIIGKGGGGGRGERLQRPIELAMQFPGHDGTVVAHACQQA